jgi:hypothetical protein
MEGHKSKKPTKKQMMEDIPKRFEQELKSTHIKGMVQGYELSNQMLLEYAENHTIEEVVEFCRKNVENKGKMEEVVKGVKETIDEFDESMDKLKKVVDNQSEL